MRKANMSLTSAYNQNIQMSKIREDETKMNNEMGQTVVERQNPNLLVILFYFTLKRVQLKV